MTIPKGLIRTGAKLTGEPWKDNWITPPYILERVGKFYNNSWFDPFPQNPTFDIFQDTYLDGFPMYINPPFSEYKRAVNYLLTFRGDKIWILENGKTETAYGQQLMYQSKAICFLQARVNFIDPRTMKASKGNRSGHLLIYTGNCSDRSEDFMEVFDDLGATKISTF